mmetsp:Transcript_2237/g.6356  ORF Transcript_2237/g.6356 Transcript_2237/m.6356 type:complete len:309 (+) Transcript_2237:807-1733(+)
MPQLRVVHWTPRELLDSARLGPAPQRDFTVLSVGGGKEDAKRVWPGALQVPKGVCHDFDEVEFPSLRQTLEAKPQNAIKVEGLERILGERGGRKEAHPHAAEVSRSSQCHEIPNAGRIQATNANLIFNQHARDLPSAEGYGEGVARTSRRDGPAVGVDVAARGGAGAAVARVCLAGLAVAIHAREHKVTAACVKNHRHLQRRTANHDCAVIGAADIVFIEVHGLPGQLHGERRVVHRPLGRQLGPVEPAARLRAGSCRMAAPRAHRRLCRRPNHAAATAGVQEAGQFGKQQHQANHQAAPQERPQPTA